MRFTDILSRLKLSKGTLHRVLAALATYDLVRYDPSDQVYVLGPRLLAMAHSVWNSFDVRGVAAIEVEQLAASTGETVCLSQLDGQGVIVIDNRENEGLLAVRLPVGRRDPGHCTAAGKIMLAYLSAERQGELVKRLKLVRLTGSTIVDPQAFRAELQLSRARGYAISDEEQAAGVRSVAAPIFSRTGEAVAALSVTGPSVRLDMNRLHAIGRDLIKAAHRITGNLGGTALHVDTPPAPAAPSPGVDLLLEATCLLGDSPYWSVRDGLVYFVDILAPAVNRMRWDGSGVESLPMRELVGFVLDRASGGSVSSTQKEIVALDFGTGSREHLARAPADAADFRVNDAKCDRAGRLWAGTMSIDATPGGGALFRLDAEHKVERVRTSVTIANGLAWSPDNRIMYFADSGQMTLYAYDYDFDSGAATNGRVLFKGSEEVGRPSGITVDAMGCLWCAMWDAWSIVRLTPDGRIDRTVWLPVPRPASCAFVGPDLDVLAITTARIRLSEASLAEAPLSGSVFAFRPSIGGIAEVPFAG